MSSSILELGHTEQKNYSHMCLMLLRRSLFRILCVFCDLSFPSLHYSPVSCLFLILLHVHKPRLFLDSVNVDLDEILILFRQRILCWREGITKR